jgi:2-polyprenyl-3-methyl-5-hydroxy-6-metoxy-1,4-benzoquinol methylase
MITVKECPGCGSGRVRPYSFTVESERGGALHYAQSHCRRCDLVFSNPVASVKELEAFYSGHYYEEEEPVYAANRPDLETLIRTRAEDEKKGLEKSVLPYVSSGVFFEIGAGYGALMEGARRLGFRVAGVEASEAAARFGREVLGLSDLRHGLFDAKDWPQAFCDAVYSYHVIEHVSDPKQFVKDMNRIMKPGAIAVIGTENHHNSLVWYRRMRNLLKGRTLPEFQTASHHTFYFSDNSLRYLLEKEGFEIVKCLVYTHSLEDKLSKMPPFKSGLSKAVFYGMHYADTWMHCGNRILIWARKPRV